MTKDKVHSFKVSSVEENINNIRKMIQLLREHVPDSNIIFTLSPVPLRATFRPVSSITANSVSKSILRAALDQVLREYQEDSRLFYWPSYEIVKEGHVDPYMDDNRHIKPNIIQQIMRLFHKYYLME